ncbi:MAG: DUF371 domain-containing protein [Candidatus Heimdallarchaeaceae archaeon]
MQNYSFTLTCKGHENILALHPSTIEITREHFLTLRGDCIIGINATLAPKDFPQDIKKLISQPNSKIKVSLITPEIVEVIEGYGHPNLTLTDSTSFVIRRSSYVCGRTLMINANKAAKDISRTLVNYLKSSDAKMKILIEVSLE